MHACPGLGPIFPHISFFRFLTLFQFLFVVVVLYEVHIFLFAWLLALLGTLEKYEFLYYSNKITTTEDIFVNLLFYVLLSPWSFPAWSLLKKTSRKNSQFRPVTGYHECSLYFAEGENITLYTFEETLSDLSILLQSNLDYLKLDHPDFSIILTFFSDPSFSWILISQILCAQQNFFPSNYVMKLRSGLNLFPSKAHIWTCFVLTRTITNTMHFTDLWLA